MNPFDSNVRSERIFVSLPPKLAARVKELAQQQEMSESAAVRAFVIEGIKAVDESEGHPYRRQNPPDQT